MRAIVRRFLLSSTSLLLLGAALAHTDTGRRPLPRLASTAPATDDGACVATPATISAQRGVGDAAPAVAVPACRHGARPRQG